MSRRHVAVAALALVLAGCVHVGLPSLHKPAPVPVAAVPAPPVCPGYLLADAPTDPFYAMPKTAGIPQATTAAQSAAMTDYLGWLKQTVDGWREAWATLAKAKAWCSGKSP